MQKFFWRHWTTATWDEAQINNLLFSFAPSGLYYLDNPHKSWCQNRHKFQTWVPLSEYSRPKLWYRVEIALDPPEVVRWVIVLFAIQQSSIQINSYPAFDWTDCAWQLLSNFWSLEQLFPILATLSNFWLSEQLLSNFVLICLMRVTKINMWLKLWKENIYFCKNIDA